MFIVKIHQPGIEVKQIRQVDNSMEFCQEFFDDVAIPAENVVGEVNDGWTVASRLLVHERNAVGGGSPYTSGRVAETAAPDRMLVRLAQETGRSRDPYVRQLVGEAQALQIVQRHVIDRITKGMASGKMAPATGAVLKLFGATATMRRAEIAAEIGGPDLVARPAGSEGSAATRLGQFFLVRQSGSLGGGSNEMQRNIISERVLGMPREWAADKDVPYRDVRKG